MIRSISIVAVALLAQTILAEQLPPFSGSPILGHHQPQQQTVDQGSNIGKPRPSEVYPYHAQLDQNYEIHWRFNDTHIVFELIVHTNGYVGFGISSNGKMYPADIIIGWVKDGQTHFSDRHSEGHYTPAVDTHQDWHLLSAQEVGDYTVLKVERKLDTCDPQDRPILDGTTRVIYSYHVDDPTSENALISSDQMHGSHSHIGLDAFDPTIYHGPTQRGTKSLLLLDPPSEDQAQNALPGDTITMDFLNPNYTLPATDTYYHCMMWKLPDLGGKVHLIRFEPVIQKGHENLVHHMILFYCGIQAVSEAEVGTQFNCYGPQRNPHCEQVFMAWTFGGTGFNFPANTGMSMGTDDDPKYVLLEIHYDNPAMRADYVDGSGMRLFITHQLRQHDAAILVNGVNVDMYQIIPPYDPNFLSSGYCHENCISEALGNQEIRVFANLLHSHSAGVKLRTRHFRNGVELPPLSEDNAYDSNFQEMRARKEERVVKKGDRLVTECNYDTTQRTGITYGGLSIRHEMCLDFILYYPRINMGRCHSRIIYKIPPQFAGQSVFNIVNHVNWTDASVRQAFKKDVYESNILHFCYGQNKYYQIHGTETELPTIVKTYQRNDTCTSG